MSLCLVLSHYDLVTLTVVMDGGLMGDIADQRLMSVKWRLV